jgi:preprotein translocase subunit YajC
MGKKKTTTGDLQALKIGSRVRCTDDGVTGRIAWANATSVKIKWDDGEEVTWKRDSLATRPIEILSADEEAWDEQPATPPAEEQVEEPATQQAPEQVSPAEVPAMDTETAATAPDQVVATEPQATDAATPEQVAEAPGNEATTPASEQADGTTPALAIYTPESAAPAKPKRERKAKTAAVPKEKKVSAIDAAARVLAEAGVAMTCKEMVAAMAMKGYWTTPGGKTPDATLCSAILREIKVKGVQSRFIKTAPGRFASRPTA